MVGAVTASVRHFLHRRWCERCHHAVVLRRVLQHDQRVLRLRQRQNATTSDRVHGCFHRHWRRVLHRELTGLAGICVTLVCNGTAVVVLQSYLTQFWGMTLVGERLTRRLRSDTYDALIRQDVRFDLMAVSVSCPFTLNARAGGLF
jgi:hypothetical protein